MSMSNIYSLVVIFILIFTTSLSAQDSEEIRSRARFKGEVYFDQGKYAKALDMFETHQEDSLADTDESFLKIMSQTYFKLGQFDQAVDCYFKVVEKTTVAMDTAYFCDLVKRSSKVEDHQELLNKYLGSIKEEKLDIRKMYDIKPAHQLNSEANEFSAVAHNGEIYFATNRDLNLRRSKTDKNTSLPYYDLYKIDEDSLFLDGFSFDGKPFSKLKKKEQVAVLDAQNNLYLKPIGALNTKYNDGPLTFRSVSDVDSDGATEVYVTRNEKQNEKGDDVFNLNVYKAKIDKEGTIKEVSTSYFGEYFSPSSVGHITFSPDGKQACMVANYEGGLGRGDLWFSYYDNGSWSVPINAGDNINTEGDELFPYWAEDGYLYFASDGHKGYGGLDVYKVDPAALRSRPINLGGGLNSKYDDFCFTLDENGEGFFTSNRTGGQGMDDIYYAKPLRGSIVVELISDPEDAVNPWFRLEGENNNTFEPFNLKDELSVAHPELVYGDYKLIHILENDTVHQMAQLYQDELILYVDMPKIVVDTLPVRFSNFMFDKNSEKEIVDVKFAKLVDFLKNNRDLRIVIKGHTDQFGTVAYNDALGMRRANAMEKYLLEAGVTNKVTKISKGRSELVSKVDHRLNRRVDIELYEPGESEMLSFVEKGDRGLENDLIIAYDDKKAFDNPIEEGYYIGVKSSNRYKEPYVLAAQMHLPENIDIIIYSDSSVKFDFYIKMPFETESEAAEFAKELSLSKTFIQYLK